MGCDEANMPTRDPLGPDRIHLLPRHPPAAPHTLWTISLGSSRRVQMVWSAIRSSRGRRGSSIPQAS